MRVVKLVRDLNCPKCDFPEMIEIVEKVNCNKKGNKFDLGKSIRLECSSRECDFETTWKELKKGEEKGGKKWLKKQI